MAVPLNRCATRSGRKVVSGLLTKIEMTMMKVAKAAAAP
jgi:hypothetical protein